MGMHKAPDTNLIQEGKEYHRKNGVITLLSRNPNGQNFEWNIKEQPGFIQWMFPVMQIMINTRAQRHARAEHEFD